MIRRGLNPCSRKMNRHHPHLFDERQCRLGDNAAYAGMAPLRARRPWGLQSTAARRRLARRSEIPSVGSRPKPCGKAGRTTRFGRNRQSLRSEAPPQVQSAKSAATTPSEPRRARSGRAGCCGSKGP